jgi:phage shock protein PspC (stress-responsive transcriptional regulator)
MSANIPVAPPPLTRRDQRKVVAGVCSGVAYRLGIDPNVVRVVTVVLALFGGAGILLYALGWLLLPEDRTGQSLAERALRGGGPDGASTVLLAILLAIVAVGVGVGFVADSWFGITVLVVAVAIGAVLLNRRPVGAGRAPAPAPAAATPAATLYDTPAAWEPTWASRPPSDVSTSPHAAPESGRRTRPRSYLGAVTAFAALAVTGLLGIIDVNGADLSASTYLAAALAVVGTGLVVGAWFGRSRALIGLGVALVVVLVPVATIERLDLAGTADEAFESILVEPVSATSLDGALDEYVAGDIRYDLSDLSFTDRSIDTEVRVGAGTLDIDLPPDVTLVLDAEVGAGQIDVLGEQSSGLGVSTERTYKGEEDGGTLRLVVRMGFGDVEVNRAAS